MASALCGTVLAAWGLMLLSGCGHSGPEVVPVRGRVTFGGGDWPKPGVLYFTVDRAAAGFPGRPGTGHFDTDGNLTVTTFTKGDGLIPGHYKIGVECWEVTPVMGSSGPPRMYVPAKYQSPGSSGLELTVEPGQSMVEVSFDIPKR
jgi:hypothetical protein